MLVIEHSPTMLHSWTKDYQRNDPTPPVPLLLLVGVGGDNQGGGPNDGTKTVGKVFSLLLGHSPPFTHQNCLQTPKHQMKIYLQLAQNQYITVTVRLCRFR